MDPVFNAVAAPGDQDGPLERADDDGILVAASCAYRHEPGIGATARFALVEHFGFGVKRIACKDRVREPDILPAEVGDCLLAHVADAHADHDRDRQWTR